MNHVWGRRQLPSHLRLDVIRSRAQIDPARGTEVSGNSFASRYDKYLQSRTNLRFAGYRYSTEGYRDFDEAVNQRTQSSNYHGNLRSRLETSVYQRIGNRSAVSLTLGQDDFPSEPR